MDKERKNSIPTKEITFKFVNERTNKNIIRLKQQGISELGKKKKTQLSGQGHVYINGMDQLKNCYVCVYMEFKK